MFFPQYEVLALIKNFPNMKAPLETDFEDYELAAIKKLGVLKNETQFYLGKARLRFLVP